MGKLRISDEVGTTVFEILLGLAVLCFSLWIIGTGGCSGASGDKISPIPEKKTP